MLYLYNIPIIIVIYNSLFIYVSYNNPKIILRKSINYLIFLTWKFDEDTWWNNYEHKFKLKMYF